MNKCDLSFEVTHQWSYNALCRLCAKGIPTQKLIDLKNDVGKYHEINLKLTRLHSAIDFDDDALPATVCYECCTSLQDAYEFVITVEQATVALNNLKQASLRKYDQVDNVKHEETDDSYHPNISPEPFSPLPQIQNVYSLQAQIPPLYKRDKNSINPMSNDSSGTNLIMVHTKTRDVYTKIEDDLNILPLKKNQKDVSEKPPIIIKRKANVLNDSKTQNKLKITQFNNKTDYNPPKPPSEIGWKSLTSIANSMVKVPLQIVQVEQTWKDYNWKCSICETQFPTCSELTEHSMQLHSRCNAFSCLDCNRKTSSLNVLIAHVKRAHKDIRNDLKESCHKCFKVFQSNLEKSQHRTAHLDTEYTCPGCNTCFKTLDELNIHKSTFYSPRMGWQERLNEFQGKFSDLTCLLCNKTYASGFILYLHFNRTHLDRIKSVCEACGKKFNHKATLKVHMICHSDLRPFRCEVCQETFKSKLYLKRHVDAHDQSKKFSCETCEKKFRTKRHLTIHQQIHSDSLQFVCKVCTKWFRRKSYLTRHMRQHTGVKSYCCETCDHFFTYWSNYNKHMKAVHGTDMTKKKRLEPNDGGVAKNITDKNLLEWIEEQRSAYRNPRTGLIVDTNVNKSNENI